MSPSSPLPLTFIHVSDLHFGAGPAGHRFNQAIVTEGILRDVKRILQKVGGPPDWIFVTGDVAFSGQAKEYESAHAWLVHLCEAAGVKASQVFLVPGNHDGDRRLVTSTTITSLIHHQVRATPAHLDELLAKPAELATTLFPKQQAWADFTTKWGTSSFGSDPPWYQHALQTGQGAITVMGLNSCLASFDDGDKPKDGVAQLTLGKAQFAAVARVPDDTLLVILLHHPLEWLTDGQELETHLSHRPHLMFSGHVHEPGGGVTHRLIGGGGVHVVAGAAHPDAKEKDLNPAYSWGRLGTTGLELWPRRWAPDHGRFLPDGRVVLDRERIVIEKARLPESLTAWLKALDSQGSQNKAGTSGKPRRQRSPKKTPTSDTLPPQSLPTQVHPR